MRVARSADGQGLAVGGQEALEVVGMDRAHGHRVLQLQLARPDPSPPTREVRTMAA